MKFSEFYKLLEEHGWRKDGGSKHEHYVHPDYDYFIPVGRHPSKEVPKGTLNKMLKDAGIKKQWKDMVQHHPFKLSGVVFKWRFTIKQNNNLKQRFLLF